MSNFNWPSITTSSGPVQFVDDGVNTQVSLDTVTPANSNPLPVTVLNPNGTIAGPLALETTQVANGVLLGAVTETAPATDTASSGLNGRLQRIAQRLTSLIAFFSSDFGLSSASIRTAAQIGNASGSADFNSGLASAQTIRVVGSSSQYVNSIRLDYSVTNVTTGAWVQLIATVGATDVQSITLFDGGGFAMELGIGAAASEVRTLLIPPGGFNGVIPLNIPANSRLSIRAIGASTVNAGEIDINLLR